MNQIGNVIISPDTKYMGAILDSRCLSVGPSVEIFCEDYFSKTIRQNFMKLHSNDG